MARALASGRLRKRQSGSSIAPEAAARPVSRLVTAVFGLLVAAMMLWSWSDSIEHLSRDEARAVLLLAVVASLVSIHAMACYFGIIDALKSTGETHSGAWDTDGSDGD